MKAIILLKFLTGSSFCYSLKYDLANEIVINYDPKVCFTPFDNLNYNLKALISLSDKFKITVVSPNYRTIENESVLNNLNSLGAISKVQFDNQLYNSVSAITKVPNGFYIADKLNNVIAVGNLESALFASIFLSKIISIPQVKNE